jgi:hypothetical protein
VRGLFVFRSSPERLARHNVLIRSEFTATACFNRVESAARPAARANLKQTAHLYFKEAVAVLRERPSVHSSVTTDWATFDFRHTL